MDWQKNLLIAAILAVLFMLAIRWNTYQELHAPVVSSASTSEIPSQTVPKASDIPSVTTATSSVPTTTPAVVSTSLIKVTTDSLLINIDPVGGDIVRVALPKHLENKEPPEFFTYIKELFNSNKNNKTEDLPFVLIDNNNDHIYIAQSGLTGNNGTDKNDGTRPTFSVEKNEYVLENGQDKLVVDLILQQDQVKIIKRFSFSRGQYLVSVEYIIDNQSSNKWSGNLYGQIKRDSKNFAKSSALMMSAYLGGALTTNEENYKKVTFDSLKKAEKTDFDKPPFKTTKQGGWVSLVQHYFISAWIPDPNTTNTFSLRRQENNDVFFFSFIGSNIDIAPGSQGIIKANFYAGPKDTEALENISPHLDLTSDYGPLWMISKPLFALLKFIHNHIINNWGVAIILLTLCVKTIFLYPSAISYRSMAKMRKLAPKMQEMKERFGDDRQKMSQEMMKLYKDEKVNPLGGCLPMLIQMPVFLALYWVLMESVELRHAPFYGWITDLSMRDPLFVLPLIYGATMWFMQKLNPQPTDPMQARVMQLLPIIFTGMFMVFPAGLVLYWVTNNTLTIIQQYIITKQIENADAKA